MKKETKHYTLVSFLETTKPLVKQEIIREYPHINVDYYDKVADKSKNPYIKLINKELGKRNIFINSVYIHISMPSIEDYGKED